MRFVVQLPTRSRPKRALFVIQELENLRAKSANNEILYNIVVDTDDDTMRGAVRESMESMGCHFNEMERRPRMQGGATKIAAVNFGVPDPKTWDVIILASDDMTPVMPDWDEDIRVRMEAHFPDLGGALHYSDGRVMNGCATYNIIGRALYRRLGYIYYPGYITTHSDVEYTQLLRQLHRLPYTYRTVFRHDHPAWGRTGSWREGEDMIHGCMKAGHSREDAKNLLRNPSRAYTDRLYAENLKGIKRDAELFVKRQQEGFCFPGIKLSILIPSLHDRRETLKILLAELEHQILDPGPNGEEPLGWAVEICIDVDGGELAIGSKRNRLLRRALGNHVCFIDDDDWIAPNYCRRIVGALDTDPDCIGISGEVIQNGRPKGYFHHRLGLDWLSRGSDMLRSPNHLNPIRRSIAAQVMFEEINVGEDYKYSLGIAELLKTSVDIEETMYYYRHVHKAKPRGVPEANLEDAVKQKEQIRKRSAKIAEEHSKRAAKKQETRAEEQEAIEATPEAPPVVPGQGALNTPPPEAFGVGPASSLPRTVSQQNAESPRMQTLAKLREIRAARNAEVIKQALARRGKTLPAIQAEATQPPK